MRIFALAGGALALGLAAQAQAAPASVDVRLGPELQAKAARLGQHDLDQLADHLRVSVIRELARTGAYDKCRVVLELTDARPNRPTFRQMADNPSLSFRSTSAGGARIEGHVVMPDGHVIPVSYRYYDPDVSYADGFDTWYEADWTIDRFARDLARGRNRAYARR